MIRFTNLTIYAATLTAVLSFANALAVPGQHTGHTPGREKQSKNPAPSPTPSPSPSAEAMPDRPRTQMPAASPNQQASPEQKMNMLMSIASPSPSAMGEMKGMPGMETGPADDGSLLVMSGSEMGVNVGASSEKNAM